MTIVTMVVQLEMAVSQFFLNESSSTID